MKEETFEAINMDERNNTEKLLDSVKRFDFCDEEEFGIREDKDGGYVLYDDYIAMEKYGLSQTDFIELRSANVILEKELSQKWVSAKDRLPESNIEVIVFRQNNGLWWGVWHGDLWLIRYADGWTDKADVTHWMPLPRIPVEA